MSDRILETIENFAGTLLPPMGLELVEVQFRREGHGWVLRIFIDSEQGVSLENCTDVSRQISAFLDVEDLIDHAYHLEVSSPGLERPLRTPADFSRCIGKNARLKLRELLDGEKVVIGIIRQVTETEVVLGLADEREIPISFALINKARLSI